MRASMMEATRGQAVQRLRLYPLRFAVRHPLRMARNLLGNRPSRFANRYLGDLSGIEIGAASYNRYFLDTINIDHRPDPGTDWGQRRFAGGPEKVDVLARAADLPFEDDSHDFVLASHVLEHIPDPIRALAEWLRVARRYVFIVLPHHCKEDRDLDLTPAEELFDRYRECFDTEEDWHWQRWTSETFRDLCERLGVRIVDLQDPDDKRGNGFAVVLDASRSPRLPSEKTTGPQRAAGTRRG